jgi:adenylosuccinate lyase
MNECLEPRGERDRSAWYVEFALLPESCCYLARMLANTEENLTGLTVRPEQMEANLRRSGSLVLSEAVMIALAEHVGRQTAHSIVHENAMQAVETDRNLRQCLADDPRVTEHLSEDDIASLTDVIGYTGMATEFVGNVLDSLDSETDET